MAVRTGAGTGVVVSLVVFILTTVFLLVLTIAIYSGKTNEMEAKTEARNALTTYVTSTQRSSDQYKAFESAAKERNESVAQYLNRRYEEMRDLVINEPNATPATARTALKPYGLDENESVRNAMRDLSGQLRAQRQEIESLNARVSDLTDELAQKDQQTEQLKQAQQQERDSVEGLIAGYRDAAEDYRKRLETAIDDLNQAKDDLRASYESQLDEANDEINALGRELTTMRGKLQTLEAARAQAVIRGKNPALLVDGRIIDAPGSADEVFINRGRKDRIVLGMTFEVYGNPNQIVVNQNTGELPRGKASLQVVKVDETTSTAKITRTTPGQPIVRDDVIANAVYDPTYKFKFLIHGKFDLDGDARPTEDDAEYLRSLVMKWGGTVVTGEELPGDLDFLVLGAEPPNPPPLPQDAPRALIDDYIRKKQAYDIYNQLFRQAAEAQIPVLNSNRFFTLIGYTDR